MRTLKPIVRVGLVALTLVGACSNDVTAPKAQQTMPSKTVMLRTPEDAGPMFPGDGPVVDQGTGTARGGYMVTSGRR